MSQTVLKILLIVCMMSVIRSCDNFCLECSSFDTCIACKGTAEFDVNGNCVENTVDKCITYGPNK